MVRKIFLRQNIMVHTYLHRHCMVFLLLCELTRLAILWSKKLDSTKWHAVLIHGIRKTMQFRGIILWMIIFHFLNIFPTMHFIINGFKRFSKTNSTNPRQRVPLSNSMKMGPVIHVGKPEYVQCIWAQWPLVLLTICIPSL